MVNNDKANKSLDDTDKRADKTGKTFGSLIATGAKVGAGILAGAAVAGGAMLGLATKAGNAADRLLDLSSITGMTTDEIQKWERVTTVAGVSLDTVTNASQKFTKSLDVMGEESNKGRAALGELGFSLEGIKAMNADQRMDAIVDSLGKIEDPTERARLGTDLLGGSWKEIAPILDVGADRLKKVKDNANIISEEDLNKANEFRIKMDQMKEKAGVLGMELGISLIPMFQSFFDWIDKYMPTIQAISSEVFNVISDVVETVVGVFKTYFLPILENVFNFVQENWPTIQSLFDTVFSAIVEIANTVWTFFQDNILPIFDELVGYIMDHWPEIKETFESVFNAIVDVVSKAWAFFKENLLPIIESFYGMIREHMPQIKRIVSGVFNIIKDVVTVVWDIFENMLLPILGKLWDFIEPHFPKIGDIIETAFDIVIGIVEGVVTVFENVTEAIKDAYDWLTSWNDEPVEDKNINAKVDRGANIGMAGNNAQGTDYWRGGLTWVGEQGPELINAPSGSQIFSNGESMAMAGGGVTFGYGAFAGANIMDDYGVDRLMDRVMDRLALKGVR